MAELSNEELLAQLGVEVKQEQKADLTPRQERIIAGFEEITAFVDKHGHAPRHGEGHDIFERLYATRLDKIRASEECRNLLAAHDTNNLLTAPGGIAAPKAEYETDEALLNELGIDMPKEGDVAFLKHVKPRAQVAQPSDKAARKPCENFDAFSSMFNSVTKAIKQGTMQAKKIQKQPVINVGDWFILYGQIAYIADAGKEFYNQNNRKDQRMRVIFANHTESDMLMRSIQRALEKDDTGRRIVNISAGPLFENTESQLLGDAPESEDLASGTIYVLRSQSTLEAIAKHRDVIHKIGVTGGKVERRIANAKDDPTFLMAGVDIMATYELFNINRVKLENLLHRFFQNTKLNIEITDRFGKPVSPKEWFLVPLHIIDEVVEKIKNGTLEQYYYDAESASLLKY